MFAIQCNRKTHCWITVLVLCILSVSCSVDEISSLDEINPDANVRIEYRTDLTQMVEEVRAEVADYYGIAISQVTTCFYFAYTDQGYRYGWYLNNSPQGGSYYLTDVINGELIGIIGDDDLEGF